MFYASKSFLCSLFSQLTFLGLTLASTQISFGTLMQFGFNTNLEILAIWVSNLSWIFLLLLTKILPKEHFYSYDLEMWPRNKDSFHPAILLWLEIAIFRRDVLDQVLLLVSTNLRWHLVLNTWILENSWIFEYLNTWKLEHLNTWILENVSILEYLNTNKYFSINLLCWTNFTIRGRTYLSEKLNNVHKYIFENQHLLPILLRLKNLLNRPKYFLTWYCHFNTLVFCCIIIWYLVPWYFPTGGLWRHLFHSLFLQCALKIVT